MGSLRERPTKKTTTTNNNTKKQNLVVGVGAVAGDRLHVEQLVNVERRLPGLDGPAGDLPKVVRADKDAEAKLDDRDARDRDAALKGDAGAPCCVCAAARPAAARAMCVFARV